MTLQMDLIPVTLLTGFLGAGKTSLVSRLLRDPRYSDTAVIINEFGEIGLDHLLVEQVPDEAAVEMTSGCLCCTVRGDIRNAMLLLHHRSEIGELPLFTRLIVETTGLADPAPVIHTLMTDRQLARRYRLGNVVTVVDAANGLNTLDTHSEAVKQVAFADRLVVSKTDTGAGSAALASLLHRLHALNAAAPVAYSAGSDFSLNALVTGGGFDPNGKSAQVLDWLNAECHAQLHVGHEHGHGHHHDISRHGDAIRSFCLIIDEPISRLAFGFAMELLALNQGPDILRVKGLVAIDEYPDTPVVIHMVQHIVGDPVRLAAWPSDDRRTRLVFITRNLDPALVAGFFEAWTQRRSASLALTE